MLLMGISVAKRRHDSSQPNLPGRAAGSLALGENVGAEVQVCGNQGWCCGAEVQGTFAKDIKGEATEFDRELYLRDRGDWEVTCIGEASGITYLTQPHTLYGLYQVSLGLEHRVERLFFVSCILCPSLGCILGRCQSGVSSEIKA